MSDETFFREVNEEIRQQRVRDVWSRFGRWILAAAVLAVLVAAGFVVWRHYRTSAANATGDRFISAVDLADDGKRGEAAEDLDAIAKDGFGAYPQLAALRLASIRERDGDAKAALEGFDAVARNAGTPQPLRDLAAIRAGYLLVDGGSLDDVRNRVERLSDDADPLRSAAREALGLAAWKAGNLDEAGRLFALIRDDARAPSGIALRARVMLDLVKAGTTPASAAAEAKAAPAAAMPLADTPIPLDLAPPGPLDAPAASAETPAEAPVAPQPAQSN